MQKHEYTTKVFLPKKEDRNVFTDPRVVIKDDILFNNHKQIFLGKHEIMNLLPCYKSDIAKFNVTSPGRYHDRMYEGGPTGEENYFYEAMKIIVSPIMGEEPEDKSYELKKKGKSLSYEERTKDKDAWWKKRADLIDEFYERCHMMFIRADGLERSYLVNIKPETLTKLNEYVFGTPNHEEI